jgi:hypothetical protein
MPSVAKNIFNIKSVQNVTISDFEKEYLEKNRIENGIKS